MSNVSKETDAVRRRFWETCAKLIEVYPNRPDKFSGDSEPVGLERELKTLVTDLANELCASEHWLGSASVGKGNWTNLPWVAIFDTRETKSAQKGVYPVLHISCEDPLGLRLGLGVAATEFKSDPERKAKEVHNELPVDIRDRLRDAKFVDVAAGDQSRVEIGSGKLATGYSRGMIFERFIPLQELKSDTSRLTDALGLILESYKSWTDNKYSTSMGPSFLQLMRWYADEKIVFLSPERNVRYLVSEVDDRGCRVRRLDADEAERITASAYQAKCTWLQEQGGRAKRADLDNTVARHICYAQGADLGLSADKKDIVVLNDKVATADLFISLVESISSPQLYKPLILKFVIDAIGLGELTENRIAFDWLVPQFLRQCQELGKDVSEQQVAEGFGRLAGDLFWMLAHHDPEQALSADKPTASQIRSRISHAVIKEPYWSVLRDSECRHRTIEAIERKWPEMSNIAPPQGIEEATRRLVNDIAARGFVFDPWQIAAYVTALRTKPFAILAGVSGTGKSKLPMLVAELTGAMKPRRIAVRPDWTDSSDVIGYVDLQNQFRAGVVLQEIRAATRNPDRYHVCLVDEMNLARVEHYFAEFLSAIEDRRAASDGGYESSEIITQTLPNDDEGWQTQCIPANLSIVGTVNMDETTHGFSRNVLDRAFTIELSEVDLAWLPGGDEEQQQGAAASWPLSYWQCPATRMKELDRADATIRQTVDRAIDTLERVNESLLHSQLQVGYRTRDEVALFLVNANDISSSFVTREGEAVDPLDLVLMMKVLPRLVGGSNSIRRTLLGPNQARPLKPLR